MKLTREQRSRLFAGNYRPLVFEDKPDVELGYRLVLTWSRPSPIHDGTGKRFQPKKEPLFSLVVKRIVRASDRWVVWFEVHDNRHQLRLLRGSPPAWDATLMRRDQIHPPTEGEIHRAADESSYTSSSVGAIDHLEAVEDGTLDAFAKEAHMKDAMRGKDKTVRDVELLRDQIERLKEFCYRNDIDGRSEIRVLERRLAEKLRKRAA